MPSKIKLSVLQLAQQLALGQTISPSEKNEIFEYIRLTHQPASSFKIGDAITKRSGYRYPGEIRAVFMTKLGLTRVVAEADDPSFAGMLHIFAPENLMPRRK